MRLKTPTNTQLYFRAEGGDADAALSAIVALVNNDFVGGPE
jgi:phosphotransferase system HPr-like phosphotransfer protein